MFYSRVFWRWALLINNHFSWESTSEITLVVHERFGPNHHGPVIWLCGQAFSHQREEADGWELTKENGRVDKGRNTWKVLKIINKMGNQLKINSELWEFWNFSKISNISNLVQLKNLRISRSVGFSVRVHFFGMSWIRPEVIWFSDRKLKFFIWTGSKKTSWHQK